MQSVIVDEQIKYQWFCPNCDIFNEDSYEQDEVECNKCHESFEVEFVNRNTRD